MAADIGVAVEVIGDELALPRLLQHHRASAQAAVAFRALVQRRSLSIRDYQATDNAQDCDGLIYSINSLSCVEAGGVKCCPIEDGRAKNCGCKRSEKIYSPSNGLVSCC